MIRSMIGFGVDEQGDWFAILDCGHLQHVRHQPPFINRPWVTTVAGRTSRLGHTLNCVRCDRLELPNNVNVERASGEFTWHDTEKALACARTLGAHMWLRIIITKGMLQYRAPALDVDMHLDANTPGVVPPQVECQLTPVGGVSYYFEALSIPEPVPITAETIARARY